jgi:hypothetical protein
MTKTDCEEFDAVGLATDYAHKVVDHAAQYVDGRVASALPYHRSWASDSPLPS